VFPRLQGKFPSSHMNTWADEWEGPENHWIHEGPDDESIWRLSN